MLRKFAKWRRISIHAPPAGSDHALAGLSPKLAISIHAPPAGSDSTAASPGWKPPHFDPRSPCGERPHPPPPPQNVPHFDPRSPCGERLRHGYHNRTSTYFDPRSPCGERLSLLGFDGRGRQFRSTLPLRGATHVLPSKDRLLIISIHAPPAGSDSENGRLHSKKGTNHPHAAT